MPAQSFNSSNLAAGEYDPETGDLTIEFTSGEIYRYSNVPQVVWDGLAGAGSPGSFFHRSIRNRFAYERV